MADGSHRNAAGDYVTNITRQSDDFAGWYSDVVRKAELADYSPVRGCMVIRPYGYAIWESMRDELDRYLRRTGHQNAYFPMFVPRSLLEKEAEHVEGFNPQVAWVTRAGGAELPEPLAIRPTSEALVAEVVKDWIQSYRQLPLLLNLWNNVVRWELRTRPFLRTTEFLWQEAHTFHATREEADEEVAVGLEGYRTIAEEWLALPVVAGRKTAHEKFPGAVYTHSVEAMMRDRKALQAGTSHQLGTNFTEPAGIRFLDRDNVLKAPFGTSWGFSTRMVGATVMAHGDDNGLVLPPNVAPIQLVIVPIFRNDDERGGVEAAIQLLEASLAAATRKMRDGRAEPIRFLVDRSEATPGFKFSHWELRGVPFRLEVGPRDVASGSAVLVKRVDRAREVVPLDALAALIPDRLDSYQQELFHRADAFRRANTHRVDTVAALVDLTEGPGGFAMVPWCGDGGCEEAVTARTGSTIRVVPFDSPPERSQCLVCSKPSGQRVLVARAY